MLFLVRLKNCHNHLSFGFFQKEWHGTQTCHLLWKITTMLTHWSNQETPGSLDHQVKGEGNKACHISSWLRAIGSIVLACSELTMSLSEGLPHPEQWVPFSTAESYTIAINRKKILKAHYFIDSSDRSGRVLIHPKLHWTKLRWSAILRATELRNGRCGISNFHTVSPYCTGW